jgi:two-component system cell cycle sensor histidine kinase PleC
MTEKFGLDRAKTLGSGRPANNFLRSNPRGPGLPAAGNVRELLASLAIPVLAVVVAWRDVVGKATVALVAGRGVHFKGVLLLYRQFGALARERVDVGLWRRRLASAEFFYGVAWAAVAFVDIAPGEKAAFYFLFALIMVVVAIRMIFALTVMPVIYAGTIPLTAALVLRFMLTGDAFFWTMAAVAIGIHIYLIVLVKELNFTVLAMLGYRAEKDALIAELEQAMAVSDEARKRAEDASLANRSSWPP